MPLGIKHILSAGLALQLVACSVTPVLTLPELGLPANFEKADQANHTSANANLNWWEALNQPSLNQQIELALANNQSLQAIAASLRAANASARGTSAMRWPSFSIGASNTQRFAQGDSNGDSKIDLSSVYGIDLWGAAKATYESSLYSAEAAAQEFKAAQITLSANVASLWYQITTSKQLLQLIKEERRTYESVLSLLEQRFRNGQSSASDILRQRQLVASTGSLEASTAADLGTQQHALDELLGIPAGSAKDPFQGSDVNRDAKQSFYIPSLPATGLPVETITRRPDVMQQWYLVKSANEDIAVAIADKYPQLGLNLSYATSGGAELFNHWLGSLVSSLTAPVFDAGSRTAEIERRRALLDQRLAQYRATALTAYREVQDALLQFHHQQIQVSSIAEQLRLSEAVAERQLRQLRGGSADFLALLDAQVSTSGLRRDLLSAQQKLTDFYIALSQSIAGPLPSPSETAAAIKETP